MRPEDLGIALRPIYQRVFLAPGRCIEFWNTYAGLPLAFRIRLTLGTTWLSIRTNVGNVTNTRIQE